MGASMTPDGGRGRARYYSRILFQHRAGRHLAREVFVSLAALGYHHQAARVLVQAVHDAGAGLVAHVKLDAGHVCQQGVYQRAAAMPRRRVDYHARRLVHHQQVGVLVHHFERYLFG